MEFRTTDPFAQVLKDRGVLAPDKRFEERIGHSCEDGAGQYLRPEFCALGDPAGDDGRYTGGKAEEEEVVHQVISLGACHQLIGRFEKGYAIGKGKTDKKIDNRGTCPVSEDFYECVDLVLLSYRPHLQEGESGMHGKDH